MGTPKVAMPQHWPILATGLIAGIASALLIRALPRRLAAAGLARRNFRGETIPTACGISIVVGSALALVAVGFGLMPFHRSFAAMLVALGGFGALGLADDRWGSPAAKGLRGHVRKLLVERRFTSGLAKAVGGALAGLLIAGPILGVSGWQIVVPGAIIALSANLVNLLDLRPGRATAASLALLASAMAALLARAAIVETACVMAVASGAAATYRRDALGLIMLGDTGSNAVGACVGVSFVLAATSAEARLAILIGLAAVHLIAERHSLSAIIEAHPFLRALDRLTGVR